MLGLKSGVLASDGGSTAQGGAGQGGAGQGGAGLFQGAVVESLATDVGSVTSIALDTENVYWTAGGLVSSTKKTGGVVTDHEPDPPPSLDIVVDALYLYWSRQQQMDCDVSIRRRLLVSARSVENFFSRCNLGLTRRMKGNATSLLIALETQVYLVSKMGPVAEVASDGEWASIAMDDAGFYAATDSSIFELKVNATPTSIVSGANIPQDMVVDSERLYWATIQGQIRAVPRDGSEEPTTLTQSQNGTARLAIDDDALYWTASADGAVRAYVKATAKVVEIASGQADPYAIAVDDDGLYWANRGTEDIVGVTRR